MEKMYCEGPYKAVEAYKKVCELMPNYRDMVKGAQGFCDAESGVLAISAVSIILALVLFFVAITNACKCCSCEGCCGGKKKKNFINVIMSGIGSLIALVCWIIYLALNTAYNQYKDNRATVMKATSSTSDEPLYGGWAGDLFEAALIICLIWGFFLIVQRVVQGVFSFLASREEWQEGEMTNVQMAKA
jgi:uncharacterized protein with PQ loop repeat